MFLGPLRYLPILIFKLAFLLKVVASPKMAATNAILPGGPKSFFHKKGPISPLKEYTKG